VTHYVTLESFSGATAEAKILQANLYKASRPSCTGPAGSRTRVSLERQKAIVAGIRSNGSEAALKHDHQLAMIHELLPPKNFRGKSRGDKSPFLEAASGFEPEYGALQAPA
jgi:hypothetical protein